MSILLNGALLVLTLSVMFLLIYVALLKWETNKVRSVFLYGIISVSIYFIIYMFSIISTVLKRDLIESIQNTQQYNGFASPSLILFLTALGVILGVIWYTIENYVKNHKFR